MLTAGRRAQDAVAPALAVRFQRNQASMKASRSPSSTASGLEDSMPEREEAEQADKPSVLADLKAKSEHIPPYRASGGREEVL